MVPRPDLTYPALPDADELQPASARPVRNGGMNLREGDFEWPESGPSQPPLESAGTGKERALSPFGAKLIAAMTGASTTALLMTPFDVLKTRMQTVKPHPRYNPSKIAIPEPSAAECCQTTLVETHAPLRTVNNTLTCFSSSSGTTGVLALEHPLEAPVTIGRSVPPAPEGCLYPSKWAGIWGETLSMDAAMLGVNGSRAGTATLSAEAPLVGGFWQEIAAVRRETGVRGLWKGVGTSLVMGIPSAAIYMLGYEKLLSHISPHFTGSTDPARNTSSLNSTSRSSSLSASLTPAPLIAGSVARTISATVISPIEMFRTRLQALPEIGHGSPTYASTVAEMSKLFKAKGRTILWRGLGPTLWRDVPFSGIYWAGFELIKTRLNRTDLSPTSTSFLSGAISGTISALVTQPFDVLKTRRQVFTPSPDCSPEALSHRASTLPLAMHVIRTEGWGALFAGLVPRCGKVAPACGLMIACYEGVGRYLGGREDPAEVKLE